MRKPNNILFVIRRPIRGRIPEKCKHLLSKDFPEFRFRLCRNIMKLSDLGKELINIQTFKKQNTGTNTTNGINSNIKEIDMNNIKIKKFGWIPDNSGNNGTICFNTKSDANRNQIPDEKCLCIYEIPKSAWEFEIGGIEQLKNWLSARKYNDRKDNQRYEPGNEQGDNKKSKPNKFSRTMRIEELNELLSIINAIIQTIEIKKDINSIFNSIQEWRIITSNHHFKSDLE